MSHQQTYLNNEKYAEFLAGWDSGFYAKYADALKPDKPGGKALDVGCGVGQVLVRLQQQGYEAYGVDVSKPNIERASKVCSRARLYDGKKLPFDNEFFDSAGALNVLEHVEEPEQFIAELVRVVKPGGKVVLSSPNFLRVIGFRDYHPKMRGLKNKWLNFKRIRQKLYQMRFEPNKVKFDRMNPIIKEPFTPDDDAIIATNPFEMEFFLARAGCKIELSVCTDRYVPGIVDFLLNFGPWKRLMFNAFIIARKKPVKQ
ncbi:MAG: class I SAM-dependent methyltransferase [Limisphaerales bacterium]|jgi:SAM-dependent methyltransferase